MVQDRSLHGVTRQATTRDFLVLDTGVGSGFMGHPLISYESQKQVQSLGSDVSKRDVRNWIAWIIETINISITVGTQSAFREYKVAEELWTEFMLGYIFCNPDDNDIRSTMRNI